MRYSFLKFLSALAAASCTAASIVERQIIVVGPTTLHAVFAGEDLGALHVNGSTVTVGDASTGNLFYLGTAEGYLYVETASTIAPPPHAFLEFASASVSGACGDEGPLVFAIDSSDPCAVSTGFQFSGYTLEAGISGTFYVCDNQVFFTKLYPPTSTDPVPPCVVVDIEAPPFATPV
ncbi:hypothetical protein NM688_g7500 [Phlebia brevispora]|uniref:Uncharacterized protein n=1 Tax=Phlebia brevispora TaxID=194682 RepID=A0ACC1S4I6_9APHY|nr:hypothetical protein NM688_g7500 [Phlebia brevispora]